MWDAVVIGGGVIGCAVARELSRYAGKVCLVERNEDVCTGTSKANSAIVHAGFDAMPGTKKARFNVEGSRMMEALSHELDFSYRRCGALVLCFEESGLPQLRELLRRGEENGVEGLEILSGERLRAMEPAVSEEAVAALWAPTSAIVCPFGLTIALAENAAANGVEFRFDTRVDAIRREGDHFVLSTTGGEMESRAVISAAGVYGDVLRVKIFFSNPDSAIVQFSSHDEVYPFIHSPLHSSFLCSCSLSLFSPLLFSSLLSSSLLFSSLLSSPLLGGANVCGLVLTCVSLSLCSVLVWCVWVCMLCLCADG